MNLFLDELRLRQELLLSRRSKECLKFNRDKNCINFIDMLLKLISEKINDIVKNPFIYSDLSDNLEFIKSLDADIKEYVFDIFGE